MFKQMLFAAITTVPALAHAGAQLTEIETRWLKAAAPVLAYAQRLKLPIDIIVQPRARPSDVPLAVGFMDGRCKLVLSMRGNPDAEKLLDSVPQEQRGVLMEAMAAHEVGHCWRYAQGAWHALPTGFTETAAAPASGPAGESAALRDSRREEGFADMVALAWTQRFHADSYGPVYAWLAAVRAEQPAAGGAHDTRAWASLAADGGVFKQAATPFDAAGVLWRAGLLSDD
ncbi:hypothetical protein [Massilia sp. TSP1-1-2]|uniref:hypothetical protein n=1 Tax=Massilia sp. TSP1-1-2 TaxID=2804649 RepID=UPI003CE8B1A2